MTGFHDKRATSESRRTSLKRSRPAAAAGAGAGAAPPPARRTKHAEVPVPPRKREHSVPAARAARSLRLPDGERDSEDVAPAPPPPKRSHSIPAYGDRDSMDVAVAPPPAPRAEAPAHPPKRNGSARAAWSSTAYVLRNRQVNRKPCSPARYENREELEHDRSCSSTKELEDDVLCQAPACAQMALEHYNSMRQGDEHELVVAVGVHAFVCCGMWLHVNFLARRKGTNNSVDLVPKYFFAELNLDGCGLLCASCVKIDSVESKNLGGCGECPGTIMHPADGGYIGAQSCRQPVSANGQPAYGDRDPMDVAVAPPTAPRVEAPVPRPHSPYALRNRHVPGTSSNRKTCIPARKEKREELKHDRPCSSRNKPKQPEPWEAISCARMGLEHYNSMIQGGEHELVKAVGVHSFIWSGVWLHANFVARSKGANSSVEIVPKMFFAELKIDGFGLSCASCVKIDSGESNNLGGCEHCQGKIMHPAYGVYLGSKDRRQAAAAGVYLGAEEDGQHADDLGIEFDF